MTLSELQRFSILKQIEVLDIQKKNLEKQMTLFDIQQHLCQLKVAKLEGECRERERSDEYSYLI